MDLLKIVAAAAVVTVAGSAYAQQGNQSQGSQTGQEMSQEARDCLKSLEEVDRQLVESGYGTAHPSGYGVYGSRYRTGASAQRTEGLGGWNTAAGTPRADMNTLMRAGYVLAATGHADGCQAIVEAAQEIGDRYQQALQSGEIDREELQRWRSEFVGTAIPVNDLQRPMRADEIVGADVRNSRDEKLGDVDHVLFGPNGEIQYVLVSTGGFLGVGEDEVPIRWNDLSVTASPYRDTLILDVSESTFEDAPRIEDGNRAELAKGEGDAAKRVESFWEGTQLGESRKQ